MFIYPWVYFNHMKVTVEQLECKRCGYKWFPYIQPDGIVKIPKVCPAKKCKQREWQTESKWDKPKKAK